jgi:hypothetical protein
MTNSSSKSRGKLVQAAVATIGLDPYPLDEIAQLVTGLATFLAPELSADEVALAITEVEQNVIVDIEVGVAISEDFEPWLNERDPNIEWKRWNAYKSLMQANKMPNAVIDSMQTRARKILELSGNPEANGVWSRRGLVVGDVQSGKTANYLGLFNLAADAGYRIIILLAGHTEKLRRQTQIRVDEGFIGKDSRKVNGLAKIGSNTIGVGKLGMTAQGLTTFLKDFDQNKLNGVNLTIEAMAAPVILVIKKNKKIIENLQLWLNAQTDSTGVINLPMLLLDDEADYASVNTNKPESDPTAINGAIRDLLAVFAKNSYVGFTATPFANVLIEPDAVADLFPRDFIFALESPSNYFGPIEMFDTSSDEENSLHIRDVSDMEQLIPFKHKSTHVVNELPESLLNAVRVFLLANAIRDLRGHTLQPRSMLVNVSRFNFVQETVFRLLEIWVSDLRNTLSVTDQEVGEEWALLRAQFEIEFGETQFEWEEISAQLGKSIESIVVTVVNSRNKATDWEILATEQAPRVIAVGGDVLSRGLTLEGLSSSYFYRRSLAYDTLLQMGRWFGYRDGYRDLCRVHLDLEVASWFSHIANAISMLRQDIYDMAAAHQTPREFGLKILMHPDSLMTVTALAKARTGAIAREISLRSKLFETPKLAADETNTKSNWDALIKLVKAIGALGIQRQESRTKHALWRNVPRANIADFFDVFRPDSSAVVFDDKVLANHVRMAKAEDLESWDVVLMGGNGDSEDDIYDGYKMVQRTVRVKDGTLYVGGSKHRLGGRGDLGQVFAKDEATEISLKVNKTAAEMNDADFLPFLTNPTIILYAIDSVAYSGPDKLKDDQQGPRYVRKESSPGLIGLIFAIPAGESGQKDETVRFMVNKVWQRQEAKLIKPILEDENVGESEDDDE